jgi:hypothetical protein
VKRNILIVLLIVLLSLLACTGRSESPLAQANEGALATEPPASAEVEKPGVAGFNPDADPITGVLYLGGGENAWLDPMLVSLRSGLAQGAPSVKAETLGENCTGLIPTQPDLVFNWKEQPGVEALRIFTLSMGDPTLVVVTPSGKVICGDDLNPLVLDPQVEIKDPEVGRYSVFLGSIKNETIVPAIAVITTLGLDPSRLDLAQLMPRQIDPRGIMEKLPLDVLDLNLLDVAQPPDGKLGLENLPYQEALSGGGLIGAFNLDQSNPNCTGFIKAAPTFRFEWSGELEQMVLFFESDADTTLVVRAPDGAFFCDDDASGTDNLNPVLSLKPVDGLYRLWVGSSSPDAEVSGKLTVTADAAAQPVPLTSDQVK